MRQIHIGKYKLEKYKPEIQIHNQFGEYNSDISFGNTNCKKQKEKGNSETYKYGNTNRETQIGKYQSGSSSRGTVNNPNRNIHIGKYQSEHTHRNNTNQKTQIGEIPITKYKVQFERI